MAFDIVILKDDQDPSLSAESGLVFWGEVDLYEWESLLFTDLGIMSYSKYVKDKGNVHSFHEYYSEQLSFLAKEYPMIARISDFSQDAVFLENEIEPLLEELKSLSLTVKQEKSKRFLDQLLGASKLALQLKSGIRLCAD